MSWVIEMIQSRKGQGERKTYSQKSLEFRKPRFEMRNLSDFSKTKLCASQRFCFLVSFSLSAKKVSLNITCWIQLVFFV